MKNGKTTTSIEAKILYVCNDIQKSIMDLNKSLCVSRTKAEMRDYIEAGKSKLSDCEKRVAGQRNNFEPFDINREENTLYEDVQALLNKLGDIQYDLLQNDTKAAAEHLREAMLKIRGY